MAFSFLGKLKEGLGKTRQGITDKMDDLFNRYGDIDDDLFEELEEILVMGDVGVTTTHQLIEALRSELKVRRVKDRAEVRAVFMDVVAQALNLDAAGDFGEGVEGPQIIVVIGVNGVGKTTSIGKLAAQLKASGKSVMIAAADTFRAAAIDQLKVWGTRAGVPVVHQSEGSDPAAVIYDAIHSARAKNVDVLICDTAGRLHNKVNLMNELAKVFRIIEREYPQAHRETLLVLDATTGQNAVMQAKVFGEAAPITGIILTKLDGTAKGGVVLSIVSELGIPVRFVGVGEGIDDLQKFEAALFAEALFEA